MKLLNSIGSRLLSLSTLLLIGTSAIPPALGQTLRFQCPLGYVCIYPASDNPNTRADNTYYRYGVYKLSNQYGYHDIVNNQTGGAKVLLCTDWNGTICPVTVYVTGQKLYYAYDLTPINSIKLIP